MSYRAVDASGSWRVYGDRSLKKLLGVMIQQKFSRDPAKEQEARKVILEHPYLDFDEWRCAEESDRRDRAKKCGKRLAGLIERLRSEREISQVGLGETTVDAKLTPQKLSNRRVPSLDLDENWLLLSLERHPLGGSQKVKDQYWLYSKRDRTLRLLHEEPMVNPNLGKVKVRQGDGSWQEPENTSQESFQESVVRLMGVDALKRLERAIQSEEDGLCSIFPMILDQCKAITGIDYEAEEKKGREIREKHYLKKYGPRQPTEPGSISFIPGSIRLGIKPE